MWRICLALVAATILSSPACSQSTEREAFDRLLGQLNSEVPSDHWICNAMRTLVQHAALIPCEAEDFSGRIKITRAMVAGILHRYRWLLGRNASDSTERFFVLLVPRSTDRELLVRLNGEFAEEMVMFKRDVRERLHLGPPPGFWYMTFRYTKPETVPVIAAPTPAPALRLIPHASKVWLTLDRSIEYLLSPDPKKDDPPAYLKSR